MKKILFFIFSIVSANTIIAQAPTLNYSNGSITGTATRTFTVASAIANETPIVTNFTSPVYVKAVVSNMQNFRLSGGTLSITQPGVLYPNGYQNYRFVSGNGRVYSLDFGGLVDAYQTAPQGSRPYYPNMGTPYGAATVAAGDLVSDPSTHRIYLVTAAATPIVVAGNPTITQSGDQAGSSSSYALMNSPMSILPIPGQRNKVWVADKGNNKIKILNVETQTTTDQVVNGVTLSTPVGLATDPTGNFLYVTDANRLIKIDLSNNNATVLAGATTAGDVDGLAGSSRLNNPMGISVDRDGNIFIADKLNHKIKFYVPSAGKLVTIAGNGTAGDVLGQDQTAQFNQPVAITYDWGSNTLQVSDYGNNKIKTLTFTTAYNINPSVPAGLSFNKFTGVISGTPTLYTPLRNYTITLDNGIGAAQIVLPIQVLDIPPTNLNYSSSANIFTVGTAITNLLPSNTGGVVASYAVYPSLPAGLTMSTTTGIISGMPTEGTVQTDYVVTGTNTGGTITSTVSIYVQGPPYNMGYSRAQAVLVQNEPAYLLALPMSYPAATSYAMNTSSPALPTGLSLNTTTGEITGTPTTISASTVFTVDVTNAFGTATGTVEIQVQAKPIINYVQPSAPYLQGQTISPLVPTLGGGSINAAQGGWSNTGLQFGGNLAYIQYGSSPIIRWVLDANAPLVKFVDGSAGPVSLAGGVPSYLIMDPQYFFYNVSNGVGNTRITKSPASNPSRIIKQWGAGTSGYLDGVSHLAKFDNIGQIATDAIGSRLYIPDRGNKRIRLINVNTNLVSTIAGSGSAGTANGIGAAASFTDPTAVTLGADDNLYILDQISSGLAKIRKLNLTTFEVTDFVSLNFSPSNYLVTDKGGDMYLTGGDASGLRRITRDGLVIVLPNNEPLKSLAISPENGDVIIGSTYPAPINSSFNNKNYFFTPGESITITPTLFAGLSFDNTNGTISGTPTGVGLTTSNNTQSYTVRAANRAGIFSTNVTLTVVRPPSGLTYQYAPWNILVGSTTAANTINNASLAVGGLPKETYSVSPTLPAGLSLNPATGQITGSALNLQASTAYTITASNAYGSTTATLYISVEDKPRPTYVGPQIYLKNNLITPLVPTNTGGAVLSPASINLNTIFSENQILDFSRDETTGNIYALIQNSSWNKKIVKLDASIPANIISASADISFSNGDNPSKIVYSNGTLFISCFDNGTVSNIYQVDVNTLAPGTIPVISLPTSGWGSIYRLFIHQGRLFAPSEDMGLWVYSASTFQPEPHTINHFLLGPNTQGLFPSSDLGLSSRIVDVATNAAGEFMFYSDNSTEFVTSTFNAQTSTFTTQTNVNLSSHVKVVTSSNGTTYYVSNSYPGGIGSISGGVLSPILLATGTAYDGSNPRATGQQNDIAIGSIGWSGNAIASDNNGAIYFIDNSNKLRKYEERVAYRISPSLPTGLTIDVQTGAISGTPTVVAPSANYLVTAFNSVGSRSANLNITVGAPISFTFQRNGNTGLANAPWTGMVSNPLFNGSNFATTGSNGITLDITETTDGYGVYSVSGASFSISPALPAGLTLNSTTGQITGTPTQAKNITTYTVTAVNAFGTSTSTLQFAITGPSNLSYGGNQNFINGIGATVQPQIGGVTGTITYAITSGSLPTGVSLNTSTGALIYNGSGAATSASSVTITASGSSAGTASVTLNVGIGAAGTGPSNLVYNSNITLATGGAISSIIPAINAGTAGAGGVTYSISPNLTALTGLTFNTSTGVIAGTPTALLATTFTVTATTAYGSTSTSFSLQVGAVPSALSYPNASYQFWRGDAISNISATVTNGTGTTSFSASGLPNGLTIDPISGTIYGIPSTAQAAGTATITASNSYGAAIANISFEIISPPTISYNNNNNFTTSQPGISLTPTITGGYNNSIAFNVSAASFSNTTGLTLNTSNGVLAGTASSTALATTAYTATISSTVNGVNKTATNSFSITIGAAPNSLSYTTPQLISLNNRITNLSPIITNGVGVVYSAAGLPAGLSIDPNTGIIFGTPTVNQSASNATITATNVYGSTQATISFAVGQAPSNFQYATSTNYLLVNAAQVNYNSSINSGSGNITYSISPGLPTGFTIDPNTGVISGATSLITNQTYLVTASNSFGSTTSYFHLATNNGPNFTYVRNHVYSAGTQIANEIPTIYYGAGSISFTVNPSLPTGLSIDPLTGIVSGTPTSGIAVPVTDYSVSGTNLYGTSNARLTIEVQGPPTNLNYGANIVQPINVALSSPIVPTVTASPVVANYTVSPSLPAGLTLNATTGAITGTPTVAQQAVTYTLSADNWIAPSATYTLTITVTAQPIISYVTPQNYVAGTAIAILAPSVQNSVSSWSISPALPAGLSFNTSTGVITGTPTMAISATTYTITATNSFGNGTTNIVIAVATPPSGLSYTLTNSHFRTGVAITAISPAINAGTGTVTYAVSPNLPAGLTINPATGVISGTPTVAVVSSIYTITATSAYGNTSTTIQFATGVAPSSLVYNSSNILTAGTAMTALTPSISAGTGATTYSVSPNLPAGLTLNSTTGFISGTPTAGASVSVGTFTITASNAFGTTTASMQIGVQGPPTNLVFPSNSLSFPINTPVTNVTPTVIAYPVPTYSVSPSLPAGLILNPSTGAITGTPTVGQPASNYTITANNGFAPNATVVISIAVPAAPIISYANSYLFTKDQLITAVQPTVINRVDTWSIAPSLPAGLLFNTSNGQITGTPTTIVVGGNYTVTASNNYGAATANFTLDIQGPPTLTLNNSNTTIVGLQPILIPAPVLNSNPAPVFSISPNLPAGLSINSSTGAITGTPLNYSSAVTYSIRATNSIGTTTIPVVLAILPPVSPITSTTKKICGKTPLQLSNTTANGVWSSLQPSIATVSNSGLVTGVGNVDASVVITYTITVQGVSNTSYDTLAYIANPALPVRLATIDAIENEYTTLEARQIANKYEWSPSKWLNNANIYNPTALVTEEIDFAIKMTASTGCITTDSLLVRIFKQADIFLPNVFSPNGDGVNETFRMNPVGIKELKYFRVFNQWGVLLFETRNVNEAWDGTFNGLAQPLASYTWLLEAIDIHNQSIRKSGTVTLLR